MIMNSFLYFLLVVFAVAQLTKRRIELVLFSTRDDVQSLEN